MNELTIKALAKLNLGLDVTGRLDNGYHQVKMIMQSVELCDYVTISLPMNAEIDSELSDEETSAIEQDGRLIHLTCSREDVPLGEANIAYRAAAIVMERRNITGNLAIHIQKYIPMAAGMAGGSTDAAAVILGLNKLFDLNMSQEEMDEIAVGLGADVPFCLRRGTYLSEGIGEKLTKLKDAPKCYALIVNPGFEVSTKEVYRALDDSEVQYHPDTYGICQGIENENLKEMADSMGNILENALESYHPQWKVIETIKKEMKHAGAVGQLMTGSGPTVFGLFDNSIKAHAAEAALKTKGKWKVILTKFARGSEE